MPLLLLGSFLLFAVFGRVFIQYIYTGDHGIRLAKPSGPLIEFIAGMTFILSFVFSIGLVLFNYFELLPVQNSLPNEVELAVLIFGIFGILITVISQQQMGRSWRVGVDQNETLDLVSHGIYARSRNPIYFGIFIYWLSLSLIFMHVAMWVSALICWLSIEVIVRKIEEPYLAKMHGEHFKRYCEATKRYLPF